MQYRIVKEGGAFYIEYRNLLTLFIWCQMAYDHRTYQDAKETLDGIKNGKGKEVVYSDRDNP